VVRRVIEKILPAFPQQQRNEVAKALLEMKQDVTRQGQNYFDSVYEYYTKTEKQDNNTACGFITGTFTTVRKLMAEAFNRQIRKEGQK